MTTKPKKTTSHYGRTSCTLVKVSAGIGNCEHIAKTQATVVKASTNLKTPKEHLGHVHKKLKKINLCKELACVEAQLKKRQDKEAQKWPNNPKVAHDCQRQQKKLTKTLIIFALIPVDVLRQASPFPPEASQVV